MDNLKFHKQIAIMPHKLHDWRFSLHLMCGSNYWHLTDELRDRGLNMLKKSGPSIVKLS